MKLESVWRHDAEFFGGKSMSVPSSDGQSARWARRFLSRSHRRPLTAPAGAHSWKWRALALFVGLSFSFTLAEEKGDDRYATSPSHEPRTSPRRSLAKGTLVRRCKCDFCREKKNYADGNFSTFFLILQRCWRCNSAVWRNFLISVMTLVEVNFLPPNSTHESEFIIYLLKPVP